MRQPFKVLVLGSGSALPTPYKHPSAQILTVGDNPYLIDCGEGTQVRLRIFKVRIQRIKQIFITHLHGDHFFGLIGLLSTMHLLGRESALDVFAPKGLKEIIDIQLKLSGSWLKYKVNFIEVSEGEVFKDKKITVTAFNLHHGVPCFGYKFQENIGPRKLIRDRVEELEIPKNLRKGLTHGLDYTTEDGKIIPNSELTIPPPAVRSFAYCSDTAYSENVIKHVAGVDILYHEATFIEEDRLRAEQTLHSTGYDAAKIAAAANVKKLLIGHFSNRYLSGEQVLNESREIFLNTHIAEEGKEFEALT